MYITCEGLRDASRDSWRTWLFRYFASRVHISTWTGGPQGDRLDTACYSLVRERDIKKNNDATCIELQLRLQEAEKNGHLIHVLICAKVHLNYCALCGTVYKLLKLGCTLSVPQSSAEASGPGS